MKRQPGPADAANTPFGELAIGESFTVTDRSQPAISSAAIAYGKRHPGASFSTKKCADGVEVTRTA